MTIQIESIVLPDLVWSDELEFTGVNSRVDETLSGRKLVWEGERKGRPITLAGTNESGWITREKLVQLYNLASVPKAIYLLVYENRNFMVRFRNEEQPCISAEAIISRPNVMNSDLYRNVLIKLMEV